jgi:ABC-type lipoprotein release transport system permease subunit
MNIFKMAWRNVWRNKRRTTVTIAAMTLALMVEVLYSGLVVGYLQGLEDDLLDLEVGDVQIYAPDYLDTPSIYSGIESPDPLLATLNDMGYPACPRLLGGALAAAEESSAGVALRGVEVDLEKKVTLIAENVADGAWLDSTDKKGVVIGRRLAMTLAVKPGDEIVLLTQAADGSIAHDLFRIRGVLLGIADGTDRTAIYMNGEAFRELMEFPEGIHQVIVRRPQDIELEDAVLAIREVAVGLDVKTWKELMPLLATMLESTQGMIVIIFLVIYIAIAILVLNAMLMAVFERVREFGILKAIGVGPFSVFGLIVVEAGLQTLAAIFCGLTLALPGMWYLSEVGFDVGSLGGMNVMGLAMRPVWNGIYTIDTVIVPIILLVAIVFCAVLYPALKAALIRPVQAMHHQ